MQWKEWIRMKQGTFTATPKLAPVGKIRYITIIVLSFWTVSCAEKKQDANPPFKPALEQVITGLIDSLGNEMEENKLLSIQFFLHENDNSEYSVPGIKMRIFLSDWYASMSIEGYTKIGNTTVAIYNIKDDYWELVNKNAITFFTDTLIGFRDVDFWENIIIPQFFYAIDKDSVSKIPCEKTFGNFPCATPIRHLKHVGISFTPPEECLFYSDSINAEKGLEYYKKEVKHFRNKKGNVP